VVTDLLNRLVLSKSGWWYPDEVSPERVGLVRTPTLFFEVKMAFKEYMKKRHMSGSKSGLCDSEGNLIEKSEPKEKKADKKMAKKEKKRAYLDV